MEQKQREKITQKIFSDNDCYKYATIRNILYKKSYNIEILANYEPRFHYISEWWKQLYGESEGKDKKGIFPASVDLTQIYILWDNIFKMVEETSLKLS